MWVDSLIKRVNGHVVEMGDERYAFNSGNGYCCDVTNPAHLARFREIPEGYQISGVSPVAGIAAPEVVASVVPVQAPQTPKRRARRFAPPSQALLMPDDERD